MSIQPLETGSATLAGARALHQNMPVAALVEEALRRGEGRLTNTGALVATTGKFTGRSPGDKYLVDEPSVHDFVAWGSTNQPLTPAQFDGLYKRIQAYLQDRELFITDGFAGADSTYRLPIRVVTEYAWHSLFARQLFIAPTAEELKAHQPAFTVIDLPGCKADPATDGTRSETFVCISFERRLVLIGGTEYAGEIKKSVFTIMNYLLPRERNVFPMHCSANAAPNGHVALFFGLSGTGKTTLSADPGRALIGDDEHGWSDQGVFNIEGGCYAKCINLSEEKEPQIWNAVRFGSVLENVVIDSATRVPDYDDASLTENTRAAYPVTYIPGALLPSSAGHPEIIVFLTADASGVLPPISKLTKEQAMYHFLSGYTSKLAGTERGVTSPQPTFSSCFGAPFLPLPPAVYAEMLGEKIDRHNARVYLVNTGWSGGPYGVGNRMKLSYTRAMVSAALDGSLDAATYTPDPVFGVLVPDACPNVPSEVLQPRNTWQDKVAYDQQARELATQFQKNFARFSGVSPAIAQAGPKV